MKKYYIVALAVVLMSISAFSGKAEYKEPLNGIWSGKDRIYRTVETVLDYHAALQRTHQLVEEPMAP